MGTPYLYEAYCQGCDCSLGNLPTGPDYQCDCREALCDDCYRDSGVCRVCEGLKLDVIWDSRRRLIKAFKSLEYAIKQHQKVLPERGEAFDKYIIEGKEMDICFPATPENIFGDDYHAKKESK